jgi:hypothetical protein
MPFVFTLYPPPLLEAQGRGELLYTISPCQKPFIIAKITKPTLNLLAIFV